jgi:hypothetical protein
MESSCGCKSWLDLEGEVSAHGSQPSLADVQLEKLPEFRAALEAGEDFETERSSGQIPRARKGAGA